MTAHYLIENLEVHFWVPNTFLNNDIGKMSKHKNRLDSLILVHFLQIALENAILRHFSAG